MVTKDADFSERLMLDFSPPKVVHLRFGNIRKREFHQFLARIWPQVEALVTVQTLHSILKGKSKTGSVFCATV
ncbi:MULTISPECIES: DUF5615 family PIN-like protein [unclassified Microcystis]|uniref:DUF5615 family PIN-like protein n=1 Tax=unclassified Microcystis TaxID=2643300 RepID=UPI00258987C8|nr:MULTISPECIES: DUF5615 family PIN-like protein [unclassified Microcystis]